VQEAREEQKAHAVSPRMLPMTRKGARATAVGQCFERRQTAAASRLCDDAGGNDWHAAPWQRSPGGVGGR
jgi:hypothetical protein